MSGISRLKKIWSRWDLLTVGMFVALDFVWDRAKEDRTEEKTIFIDECWQLLSGAGATGTRLAGDFVLEIFKTIRGYGGSAVCASQDLNDFFNLDEGRFGKGPTVSRSPVREEISRTVYLLSRDTLVCWLKVLAEPFTRRFRIFASRLVVLEKDLITTDRRELKDIVERMRQQNEAG